MSIICLSLFRSTYFPTKTQGSTLAYPTHYKYPCLALPVLSFRLGKKDISRGQGNLAHRVLSFLLHPTPILLTLHIWLVMVLTVVWGYLVPYHHFLLSERPLPMLREIFWWEYTQGSNEYTLSSQKNLDSYLHCLLATVWQPVSLFMFDEAYDRLDLAKGC